MLLKLVIKSDMTIYITCVYSIITFNKKSLQAGSALQFKINNHT